MDISVTCCYGQRTILDTSRILFSWQKITGESACPVVTQIVYKTDEENELVPNTTIPEPSDICIEGCSPWSVLTRDRIIRDRTAFDVLESLDEVVAAIKSVNPSQKFLTSRRAYTDRDARVFIPFPTMLPVLDHAKYRAEEMPIRDKEQSASGVSGLVL